MRRARNLTATVWLVGALMFLTAMLAWAQEPPDLRMLLDLDLFAGAAGNPADAAPGAGPSMVDQIRTLAALGYLGKQPAAPEVRDNEAPTTQPAANPAEFPDYQFLPGAGDRP